MLPRVSGVARRIRDSGAAFRAVVANPGLRRLELAWAFAILGHWAYTIAVSVFAYDAGGSTAVGVVFALRLFSAAVIAPFGGLLADHYRRERILLASTLTRIVLMGAATICVFADTPAVVVYVLAIAAAIATAPFRPAQAALTPSLARTPGELTAANAVVSTIESFAIFVDPPSQGSCSRSPRRASCSPSTRRCWRSRASSSRGSVPRRRRRSRRSRPRRSCPRRSRASRSSGGRGRSACSRSSSPPRPLVLGAFEVYIVVIAFQLLDHGASGVGLLNSAMGVGALLGGLVALSLTGAKRLSPPFAVGVALVGAPLDPARDLAQPGGGDGPARHRRGREHPARRRVLHARPARRSGRGARACLRRAPDDPVRRALPRRASRARCSTAPSGSRTR